MTLILPLTFEDFPMQFKLEPLSASSEALLYRGESPLFHELKIVFKDVLAGDRTGLERISSLIKQHTHMDVSVRVLDMPHADLYICWQSFNVNDVTRSEIFDNFIGQSLDVRDYAKLLQGGKGSVDHRGAVSGIFTKIPAEITVTTKMLEPNYLTADELAAGFLHEIGHLYDYFDITGRVVATSFLIQQTQLQLQGVTDLAERHQIVDNSVKILQFEGIDTEALADPKEQGAIEYVFIRNTVKAIHADMGDHKLFGAETEFLADSYAVRSGAAKPLTSLLVKLARDGKDIQAVSRLRYVVTEACKFGFFFVGVAATAGGVIAGAAALTAYAGMISALTVASSAMMDTSAWRNTPVERLEAVHADLVNLLKDQTLPSDQKQNLLSDVQFVSGLREQLVERLPIMQYLWNSLSPGRRRNIKQITLQREITKLVHNHIFVKAAQLSSIKPAVV
jgi:hypothetical protein